MDSWDAIGMDYSQGLPDDQEIDSFMWHLYKNKLFCDVVFELETPEGKVTFSAHRLVLSLWSPKFEDMFYGREKRNNLDIVPLKDTNPEAFGNMLVYLYGIDPTFDSIKKASELYKLATDFEVSSLADACRKFLAEIRVDATNVFDLLHIAERTGDDERARRCMEVVRTKTRYIMSLYECSDITPAMVHIVLDCRELGVKSEYELLNWLLAWAKDRALGVHQGPPSGTRVRQVLEEFLPKLDILDLTNEEFASVCCRHDGLFSDKEALSIFMNIGISGCTNLPYWCKVRDATSTRSYTG